MTVCSEDDDIRSSGDCEWSFIWKEVGESFPNGLVSCSLRKIMYERAAKRTVICSISKLVSEQGKDDHRDSGLQLLLSWSGANY
ncbi:MAG: hypothetical protein DCC65_02410 [Planctomycetota bacterium]|nr:MAG: hypothetical protein DCC65_02410 [Planctomycetota bacterium]